MIAAPALKPSAISAETDLARPTPGKMARVREVLGVSERRARWVVG